MSSSSVCQGLQSCLEPRVIESHILRLKLAPPRSNFSSHSDSDSQNQEKPITNNNECNKKDTVPNVGGGSGWSFLQALANTTHCNKTEEQVYVHPTVKRSSSMLSEKSLEMCTESLGNETGSNAGENSDESSLFSFESSNTCFTRHDNTEKNCVSKRVNRACSFPPPLTSMGGVHVRPHREGGRLILEAVASPPPRHCFHVERSKGRLRLCLFESFLVSDGDDEVVDGKEGIEEEEEEEEEEADEGCGEEDTEGEEELEEFVDNVEDEMEVTKFARPRSRCKESGNRDIFGDGYFELPSLPLCL